MKNLATAWITAVTLVAVGACFAVEAGVVSEEHPRLFGTRARLQQLARDRLTAYTRMSRVARDQPAGDYEKMISMALVAAIDSDAALARAAVDKALKYVDGPIKAGHVAFGTDLAICGVVFDLCHASWTLAERNRFHTYVNATVDANLDSETHVFHNGWYGLKNWGVGVACYASYYENPRAQGILAALRDDYLTRAAPALRMAGEGGGWAEGYYVHYWLYSWLFFCEVARFCEGVDYYAAAPEFYRNRAVAGMFEMFPGTGIYDSRRPIPMGDGGGRLFGGDRDKALCVRRILAGHYRDDAAHQAVHTFNQATPRTSVGVYAYKDFLWHDSSIKSEELSAFKPSQFRTGLCLRAKLVGCRCHVLFLQVR